MQDDEKNLDVQPTEEDKEWESAVSEYAADKGLEPLKPKEETKPEEEKTDETKDKNEDDKSGEDTKDGESTDEAAKTGSDAESGKDADATDGDADAGKAAEVEVPASVREARAIQREIAEDRKAIEADIRKELFGDVPSELLDADGDPIRTVDDLKGIINPVTQKAFTEDEAAVYLMQAQQHLDTQLKNTDRQVEEIAEVNLSLKDQTDSVRADFGEFLDANPQVTKELWDEYQKTLVRDEKTGIITKAPVSLESFYRTALKPYIKLAERLEREAELEEVANKAKAEAERIKGQSDRQDIYGGGNNKPIDPEEAEWAAAAKAHYGE